MLLEARKAKELAVSTELKTYQDAFEEVKAALDISDVKVSIVLAPQCLKWNQTEQALRRPGLSVEIWNTKYAHSRVFCCCFLLLCLFVCLFVFVCLLRFVSCFCFSFCLIIHIYI